MDSTVTGSISPVIDRIRTIIFCYYLMIVYKNDSMNDYAMDFIEQSPFLL